MKRILLAAVAFLMVCGLYFQKSTSYTIKSLLNQVKLSEDEAQNYIFSNISYPASVYFPNLHLLKSIALNERVEIVSIVGQEVRSFTSTSEFLSRYNEYRDGKKPHQPDPPQSGNDIKEQQRQSIEQSIASMEELKKTMPEQKEAFEETIISLKAQLQEMNNQDNQMYAEMDVMLQQSYEQSIQDYNQQLAEWEKEYPQNPAPMIRKWLTDFLDASSEVDYNAQLADGPNGKKIFVNPAYEQKSQLWKLCYRAGKETVDAVRSFSQNWLNELQ